MSYFVLSHISQNFNQNDSFDFVSKSRLVVKWMTGIKSISITKARNVQRPVSPQGSTLRAAIASNVETDIRLRSVKQMLSLIRMISEKLFLEQLRITFMMHLCHKMFWFATSFLISLHCASWRKNTIFLLGSHRKWWPGAKMVARGQNGGQGPLAREVEHGISFKLGINKRAILVFHERTTMFLFYCLDWDHSQTWIAVLSISSFTYFPKVKRYALMATAHVQKSMRKICTSLLHYFITIQTNLAEFIRSKIKGWMFKVKFCQPFTFHGKNW